MAVKSSEVGITSLGIVPIVVKDLEAAIEFYTETIGFEVRSDEVFEMGEHEGRWVTIGIPGDSVDLSLMVAEEPYYDPETKAVLESKLGSESWYTFTTDDIESTVKTLEAAGVEITRGVQSYDWGAEAMFADPFGNEFSLFQYAR